MANGGGVLREPLHVLPEEAGGDGDPEHHDISGEAEPRVVANAGAAVGADGFQAGVVHGHGETEAGVRDAEDAAAVVAVRVRAHDGGEVPRAENAGDGVNEPRAGVEGDGRVEEVEEGRPDEEDPADDDRAGQGLVVLAVAGHGADGEPRVEGAVAGHGADGEPRVEGAAVGHGADGEPRVEGATVDRGADEAAAAEKAGLIRTELERLYALMEYQHREVQRLVQEMDAISANAKHARDWTGVAGEIAPLHRSREKVMRSYHLQDDTARSLRLRQFTLGLPVLEPPPLIQRSPEHYLPAAKGGRGG